MSYGLPLEFDDRLHNSLELVGKNYLSGFPDLMKAIAAQTYKPTYSDLRKNLDVTQYGLPTNIFDKEKPYVYAFRGLQTVYAAPGRAFYPGADIRIYNRTTAGSTRTLIAARVTAYNELTGKLTFDAYSVNYGLDDSTVEVNKIPTLNARVSIFGAKNLTAGTPLAIASGGLASTTERGGLAAIGSQNVSNVAEWFCDFTDANDIMALVPWINTSINFVGSTVNPTTPEEHPGQMSIVGTIAATAGGWVFGFVGGPSGKNGFSLKGTGSFIEYMIAVSAAPTSGNNFDYSVGMCKDAAEHNALEGFGVQIIFATSAKFICSATGAASVTAATVPAANTWYKIRITNDGTNFVFVINGTTVATIAIASTTVDITNNLYMPSFGFGPTSRAAIITGYNDYVHVKEYFNQARG